MKDIIINPEATIQQAMKKLDKTAEKCLVVIGANEELLGTLTDGDLRRSILSGIKFSDSIDVCYHKNCKSLLEGKYSDDDIRQLLFTEKIDLIPIVNQNKKVLNYITASYFGEIEPLESTQSIPVAIMAGGKGTRMEPFTKILPKPLVPIHNKPIIEHIIDSFRDVGCRDYYLSVNYKARILKAYFEEVDPEYKVQFIDELKPLGTAGSLKYLTGKIKTPFFVTNCDILIKANYKTIFEFHIEGDYDITLVASAKEYEIPYGTCKLNSEGHLSHIDEKPHYDFLINTGLYVLNPSVLDIIPENEFFHITHLIEKVKNSGKRVGVFPIDDDSWIDIGQWAEYRNAIKRL